MPANNPSNANPMPGARVKWIIALGCLLVTGSFYFYGAFRKDTASDSYLKIAEGPLKAAPFGSTDSIHSNRPSTKPRIDPMTKFVEVDFTRHYFSEVLEDLHRQTGLRAAYPLNLGASFTFTYQSKKTLVRSVLQELAKQGDLVLDIENDDSRGRPLAVFWKKSEGVREKALQENLRSENIQQRCEAAFALGQLSTKGAYAGLLSALNDPSPAVAHWAVHTLNQWHTKDAGLDGHESPLPFSGVTDELESALLKWLPKGPSARPLSSKAPLIKLLALTGGDKTELEFLSRARHANAHQRILSAWALGFIKGSKSLEALVTLAGDADDAVREAALLGLGQLDTPKRRLALGHIFRTANSHEAEIVLKALQKRIDASLLPYLTRRLQNADRTLGEQILRALGYSRHPAAVPSLLKVLQDERSNYLARSLAAHGLAENKDTQVTDMLAHFLQGDDVVFRLKVIAALGKPGHIASLKHLEPLLGDPTPSVSGAAIESVANIGGQHAIEFLLRSFEERQNQANVPAAIQYALYKPTHDSGELVPLRAALKGSNDSLRTTAALALGFKRSAEALTVLPPLLKSTRRNVCFSAIRALGKCRDTRAFDGLADLYKTEDLDLKLATLRALGTCPHPNASNILIAALAAPRASVRMTAASALGYRRELEIGPALVKLMADPDSAVRREAVRALHRHVHPRTIMYVQKLLFHPEGAVRKQAIFLLGPVKDPRSASPMLLLLQHAGPQERTFIGQALMGFLRSAPGVEPQGLVPVLKSMGFIE